MSNSLIPSQTGLTLRRTDTLISLTNKLLANTGVKGIGEMSDDELWEWWLSLSDGWKEVICFDYKKLPKENIINQLIDIDKLCISYSNNIALDDLSPLLNLKNLISLAFYDCSGEIIDLNTISKLVRLETLNLSWLVGSGGFYDYFSEIYSLDFLKNMKKLRELSFGSPYIKDLSILQELLNLETLDIYIENIEDQNFIDNLKKLRILTVKTNGLINGFNLRKNNSLDCLSLSYCGIKNINFLKSAIQLNSLILSGNHIDDIDDLCVLINLENLSVFDNNISNINPLFSLRNLKKICLGSNKITDIYVLSELIDLEYLDLRENNIFDISPLYKLTNLETLIINDNPINESFIEFFRNLNPECDIYYGEYYPPDAYRPW